MRAVRFPWVCFLHLNELAEERLKPVSERPIAQNHDLIGRDYHPETARLKGVQLVAMMKP